LWRKRKPFCAINLAACERAKRKACALALLLVLLLVARNKTCCKLLSPLAVGLAATA
jgi:hypothetical protein